jgi:hypothetical protein
MLEPAIPVQPTSSPSQQLSEQGIPIFIAQLNE